MVAAIEMVKNADFFQCECAFSIVHFKMFSIIFASHVILLHNL